MWNSAKKLPGLIFLETRLCLAILGLRVFHSNKVTERLVFQNVSGTCENCNFDLDFGSAWG
jgi:hypothetical protein